MLKFLALTTKWIVALFLQIVNTGRKLELGGQIMKNCT